MAFLVVGIGHRPGGLGGAWHPRQWSAAIEVLRARVAFLVEHVGPVCVMTTARPGFELMLASAALLAKDEGMPVALRCAVPYRGWGRMHDFRSADARRWYEGVIKRPDVDVSEMIALWKFDADELRAAERESRRLLIPGAHLALACWNGRAGNETAEDLAFTASLGVPTVDVYPQIAKALRLTSAAS